MRGGTRTNILLKRRTKNNPRIVLLWLWFVLENIRLYVFAFTVLYVAAVPFPRVWWVGNAFILFLISPPPSSPSARSAEQDKFETMFCSLCSPGPPPSPTAAMARRRRNSDYGLRGKGRGRRINKERWKTADLRWKFAAL